MSKTINKKLLAACESLLSLFVPKNHDESLAFSIAQSHIAAAHAQAEDDAKPVDEAWLRSECGFIDATINQGVVLRLDDNFQLCWGKYEKVVSLSYDVKGGSQFDFCKRILKTRGDVRRLLAALEVTLASSASTIFRSFK